LRIINLISKDNITSKPYYSNYSIIIVENFKIDNLPKAILSLECDFIDINNLLSALTPKLSLSLPLRKFKEKVLKTLDLIGIGKISIINPYYI
jgi:hypothetical protein